MARKNPIAKTCLREATAPRAANRVSVPHEAESIVFGFRRDGAPSIFFGADPVYQFNAAGELREPTLPKATESRSRNACGVDASAHRRGSATRATRFFQPKRRVFDCDDGEAHPTW